MPFTIDDPDIERLARELAAATGESVRHALAAALRERLHRVQTAPAGRASQGVGPRSRLGSVAAIQAYLAALPELDTRTADEILGYDALGLPSSGLPSSGLPSSGLPSSGLPASGPPTSGASG